MKVAYFGFDLFYDCLEEIYKSGNEIIKIFPSVAEAERATGNSKHIGSVCKGKRNTAKGFKWKYVADMEI